MTTIDQKPQTTPPAPTPKKTEENIVDQVLTKVNSLQSMGELRLPPDYSAENAVRSAWLMLQEVKAKRGKDDYVPALEYCTKASIANSMLDMVLQGLSPVKKQCYFIAYGDKLQLSRSYMGTLAVARRIAGVSEVVANVVYAKDEFQYEVNADSGRKKVINHVQSLDTIDNANIKGVYATVTMADGTRHVEIMTMQQVRLAWQQGKSGGNSDAHKNFPDEMAKKSCIGRALKLLIGGTDDSTLYDDDEVPGDVVSANVNHQISQGGNKTAISMNNPPPKATIPLKAKEPIAQPAPEPVTEIPSEEEQPPY